MGDFTGFSFGGVHSDSLGIIRVSGGDRYSEQLHPEIKDITAEVPGMNGEYYFGSTYGTRTFEVEFAFDSLTEQQFKDLRTTFGTKETKALIFDERPYKTYMAKIESPIELSYVCFDEYAKTPSEQGIEGIRWVTNNGTRVRETVYPYVKSETPQRIYKGEGSVTFICYFPFAKSTFKVLPQQGETYYEGSEGWAASSGILSASQYENIDGSGTSIQVYNPGDVEVGFRLYIADNSSNDTTISLGNNSLVLGAITLETGDGGIVIDTDKQLIVGATSVSSISNNVYNSCIKSGAFFKIPIINSTSPATNLTVTRTAVIDYDYLYF